MTPKLLVPIDSSLPTTAALDHALARFADGEITVLYVIDVDEPNGSLRQRLLTEEYEQRRRVGTRTAERVLEEVRRYAAGHGVAITTATAFGRPVRRIVDHAARNGIDHVVMGTHGHSGLSRLLLGSVSEAVSERSSVPVTVVDETGEVTESSRPELAPVA